MPQKKTKTRVSREVGRPARSKKPPKSRRPAESARHQEPVGVEGPRYVELVRVSALAQVKADTPESQRRALDQLARTRPGTRIARIEALAVSGAIPLHETEQGQQLMTLAAEGFDELRLWDVDRGLGARADDPRDRLAIFSMAREASAVLVDCNGRVIDPSLELGELDYYLRTFFAAQERRKIAQRTQAGRRRLAAQGGYTGAGPIPYGLIWDRDTHTWSIDDERAAVVREIYQRCLDGDAYGSIANQLNVKGAPAPQKSRWHGATVRKILRRTLYRGEHKQEGIPVPVPAIIDDETWHKVQQNVAHRPKRKRSRVTKSLCIGRVWCPCGHRAYVRGCNGREYIYCLTRHNRWTQDQGRDHCEYFASHRAMDVDPVVWEVVADAIMQRDILEAAIKGDDDAAQQHREELAHCEAALKRLTATENELSRAFRNGDLSAGAWRAQLKEISADRYTLERNRDLARAQVAAADSLASSVLAVESQLDELRDRVRNASAEDRKAIIKSVIPDEKPYGITIWPEGKVEVCGIIPLSSVAGPSSVNSGPLPAHEPCQAPEIEVR